MKDTGSAGGYQFRGLHASAQAAGWGKIAGRNGGDFAQIKKSGEKGFQSVFSRLAP
jgi:hypothetical protein